MASLEGDGGGEATVSCISNDAIAKSEEEEKDGGEKWASLICETSLCIELE